MSFAKWNMIPVYMLLIHLQKRVGLQNEFIIFDRVCRPAFCGFFFFDKKFSQYQKIKVFDIFTS